MKLYRLLNTFFGVLCFGGAFTVYMLTLQPTVSFWDCGEFIASAYKIQVGHQPGAPLFMPVSKVFSLIASEPKQVAYWINAGSALVSAGTIMFLFWTITALASRITNKQGEPGIIETMSVMAAGAVGAMAYAVSDTFWFSAVEAEVYSFSSLFTAIVFWAILKWDNEAEEPNAGRWLVLIAYIIGLSIGIHLLSLLVIPIVVLIYYLRKAKTVNKKGIVLAILVGCAVLAFVQYGIIQYLIFFAAQADLLFVNTFGFAFGSGALAFAVAVIAGLTYAIVLSHKKQKPFLNLSLVCLAFILLGYSSYAMIIIRANAKTNINVSNPDNSFSLLGYLSREQYGDSPLLYGEYFDSEYTASTEAGNIYRKGKDMYEIAGTKTKQEFNRNTIFPRIYSQDPNHMAAYRNWLGISPNTKADFADNLRFFSSYQVGFMYIRYFFWNFIGKQNDEQGFGDRKDGNWITGIKKLDALRLGNQNELPPSTMGNEGRNTFFALPMIIGVLGLIYHFKKSKKDAAIVGLLFFFTGIAIVLYINQTAMQVRERDYAYVGSFYAFSIYIGLGVLALTDFARRYSTPTIATAFSGIACFIAAPILMARQGWDDHDRSRNFVAHDMAVNYLQSCAPNAILFCNADNDTYPLWYAQEVEGIRTDVRIVNLQLLYRQSYVDQLKKKYNNSAPLRLTMPTAKYVDGVRDYLPYIDYKIADSVELSDLLSVLTSDDENDKIEMQDGSKMNFLPTKKFRLIVNPQQVLNTKTVRPEELTRLTPAMEWIYKKNMITRTELAMMDILANNNWERPIYFTVSISDDSYFGLDNYLYREGFTYRLLPFKRDKNDRRDKSEISHSDIMYDNLMKKFEWDSFKKPTYLEPESRRITGMLWNTANTLAENLIAQGKISEANRVMQKALQKMPERNYTIQDTVNKLQAVMNLYKLDKISEANALSQNAADFLGKELNYYASLETYDRQQSSDDIRRIVAILEAFKTEATAKRQVRIVQGIEGIYKSVEGKLVI